MSTRSDKNTIEIRHLRCLYSISDKEMQKINRIQKFMKNPMKDDLHKRPQFRHDLIYMADKDFALEFEAEGFAPYEGILDPKVALNGRTTVQPLALDAKIHQSMRVIGDLPKFHTATINLPFKNYQLFFEALQESTHMIAPHVVGVVDIAGEEVLDNAYSFVPKEGMMKSWTLPQARLKATHQILKTFYRYSQQEVEVTFSAQDFITFSCKKPTVGPPCTLHILCIPSQHKKIKLSA